MNETVLAIVEASLNRCNSQPRFLDVFYEKFLASSPKVREKFAATDFTRQKRALRASLYLMLLAAEDVPGAADRYLSSLAASHGSGGLGIGAELYDLWLDCLLQTVAEIDPDHSAPIREAWEQVMMVGIHFLCTRYHA